MLLPVEYFYHDPHNPRALTPGELAKLEKQKRRELREWLAAHDQHVIPPHSGTPRQGVPLAAVNHRKRLS